MIRFKSLISREAVLKALLYQLIECGSVRIPIEPPVTFS